MVMLAFQHPLWEMTQSDVELVGAGLAADADTRQI